MAIKPKVFCQAIIAVSQNGVIGRNNGLPWHCPADLKWFKKRTRCHAIIMGYNTWESLPGILPNRKHIVVTTQHRKEVQDEGQCWSATSIREAIRLAHHLNPELPPTFIGGAQLLDAAAPYIHRYWITEIQTEVHDGDVFWPGLNPCKWDKTEVSRASAGDKTPACIMYKYEIGELPRPPRATG